MNLRYAHAKSALELVIRKGSVNISSPNMSDDKTNKVDFHAAAALIDEDEAYIWRTIENKKQ